ncbi:hypothetical protein FACS1894217_08800 [Clostridia bacterium]|nr:hypothetical protein FACS1894217_08800 [Clostridia bacterium]
MKTGRTLQELAIELDRQNNAKRDFIVTAPSVRLDSTKQVRLSASDGGEYALFTPNDLFHRQIGDTLGIPAKYYDRCRADYPELLTENVNVWLGREPQKRHMVRTLDGTARAFLSDRYRRIDNYEIAQNVLPIIGEMPDARVESCEVTDNRMYLKIVNPHLQMDVVPGDTVQAGVVISNSEVGLGSVSVMPLVYRLVCSNGLIAQDSGQRKYHVGRQNESDWEIFSDETLQLDDRAFMAKLADIVRTAVDEAKFAAMVDQLREAAGAEITGYPPKVIGLAARTFGFNQAEQGDILSHLIRGGDLSLYGLSNAVTRAASDVESYDRATALEGAGWQIVTMEPRLWRELNGVMS